MNFIAGYCRQVFGGLFTPFVLCWRHISLMRMLLRREVADRTSGTLLGLLWPLVQPTLQVAGFWFLFDIVYGMRLNRGPSFLAHLLIGMLPWLCLTEVLVRSASMFREFSAVYRRTPFPIEILPIVLMCIPGMIYTVVFTLTMGALFGVFAAFKAVVVVPLVLVWLMPLILIASVLGLFLRDFAQALPFIMMLLLYCTPILYFPDMMPPPVRQWLWINPFSDLVAVIGQWVQGVPIAWHALARLVGLWLLLLGPAWLLFRRSLPHVREVL
ncbi:MAG TPA: ABC transporter permease [Hyphomicrobiales bacterium]|nr:ABC transporter permease [Hyphomicrobiales bacterium]